MIDPTLAFHGFAVPDIDAARAFYTDVLGLEVTEENSMLQLSLGKWPEDPRLSQAEP